MPKYLKALCHAPTLLSYTIRPRPKTRNDQDRLLLSVNWLLKAQKVSGGGGYAHSYHLAYGWQPPYPETTGYIIPSLLQAGGNSEISASVKSALVWLASIQSPQGWYPDLQGNPQVFDTGQILIGLNYIAEFHPDLHDVHDSQKRAANWLADIQENDGSFIRHAYNSRPHTYYSRVGAALIKSGIILGDDKIKTAGLKNLEWTLSQQKPSGFFSLASFDDNPPFLHTMVYILEGLLDGYELTADDRFYKSVLLFTERFIELKGGLDLPRSQYNEDFTCANPHYCITGMAQWASVCFRIAHITQEQKYLREALMAMDYLAQQQIACWDKNICGALPGSVPIDGNYMKYAFPNWGIKFYIDALLEKQKADARDALEKKNSL